MADTEPEDSRGWQRLPWREVEHCLAVDGQLLNFVDVGSGDPPLLLLHGIGNTWRFWASTIATAAEGRRVIAVDLPGFGGSSRPPGSFGSSSAAVSLSVLADQLDLGQFDVCGHSMGGLIAMRLAAERPESVRRLVLVDAALFRVIDALRDPHYLVRDPSRVVRYAINILLASIPLHPALARVLFRSKFALRLALSEYVADTNSVQRDLLEFALQGVGGASVLRAAINLERFSIEGVAAETQHATTVINGSLDRLSSPSDARRLLRCFECSRLHLMDGVAHWPMIERPDLFSSLVLDALA